MTVEVTYTASEAMEILRCSITTLYRLMKRGKLGAYKLDPDAPTSEWRIPKDGLDAHRRRQKEQR